MSWSLQRRGFLKGALAAGALAPLAACAGGKTPAAKTSDTPTTKSGPVDPKNPFGIKAPSKVDAAIFNGGYGVAYAEFAGARLGKQFPGVEVAVSKVQDASKELQPRFSGGNPPDVIDNAGAGKIGLSAIVDQLEDLTDVIDSKNYEGTTIRDTLYQGVLDPGTIDGKLKVLNYVLTVYSVWYSASLFEANGWTPPKTWDEALELGKKAKEKGKYLFLWGKETADYFIEMIITSAIKEGGHEVRIGLDSLAPNAWSHPALQGVLKKVEEIVKAGYIKPGGSGTQFTAAQTAWANAQDALMYPSGSWIENEMKKQTKEGFKMTGAPAPTLTASPKLPLAAVHATANEPYIVPSKALNVAGGKEFLRAMLSKEAATNFAKTILTPSIVKDTVPADAFGSTGLASQIKMMADAGNNVFSWKYNGYYGLSRDQNVIMNSFLDGKLSVAEVTEKLQKLSDDIRNDDQIVKYKVS